MSATSHDAVHGRSVQRPGAGAPALDASDPTQDIADEVTSELAGVAPSVVAAPIEAMPAPAGGESEPGEAPAEGAVLRDRYVLEMQLGAGGTAVVFRASDLRRDAAPGGGIPVAVKLLRPELRGDPRSIARLQREFRQTQAAAHPNVVRFFDLDCDRGSWFVVMELLAGETLAARLRRAGPAGLSVREATAVAADVADALAHAHGLAIVHGDVKPANIFMSEAGGVRLLDFGVAPEPQSPREPAVGTRAYASPEVLGGDRAEAADDVFSLACVVCEMLSGMLPYGRSGADAAERAGALPERPAGLDDARWQVVERSLAFQRSKRPSMKELSVALRRVPVPAEAASASPAVVLPEPAAKPAGIPAAPVRRTRLVTAAAIAAGLMLMLGILIGRFDRAVEPVPAPPMSPVEPAETLVQGAPAPAASVAVDARSGREVVAEPAPEDLQPVPPAAPGLVTFDLPSMVVSNRAVVAAIPLRHLSRTPRDVRVNWRIIEGSARPGRDYGGPESGVESFAAGNNFRIIYVPIVANPATTRDRTFVVELTGATPGVEVGGAPRVAVTILGDG
jgi:hypothetical protein